MMRGTLREMYETACEKERKATRNRLALERALAVLEEKRATDGRQPGLFETTAAPT